MDFHGIVDHWNEQRGFGFVELLPDRRRVFVRITVVKAAGLDALRAGQRVAVDVAFASDGRPRVSKIALLGEGPANTGRQTREAMWSHPGRD
jgi:cold shock CspA family protein